jgi:hypothetical protein
MHSTFENIYQLANISHANQAIPGGPQRSRQTAATNFEAGVLDLKRKPGGTRPLASANRQSGVCPIRQYGTFKQSVF